MRIVHHLENSRSQRLLWCLEEMGLPYVSFPLEAARSSAGLDQRYPNILAWLARIHARPAYARALEAGGPYAYA